MELHVSLVLKYSMMMIIFRGYRSRRRREEDGGPRVRNNFIQSHLLYVFIVNKRNVDLTDVKYVCLFVCFLQRQLSSKEKPAAETQFDLEINSFPPLPPGPVPAVCIHQIHLSIECLS